MMKVGDLVQPTLGREFPEEPQIGIIIELIDQIEVPPVCRVLWGDGIVEKDWADELEKVE